MCELVASPMSYPLFLSCPQTLIQYSPNFQGIHRRPNKIRHGNCRVIELSASSSSSNPSVPRNCTFVRERLENNFGDKNIDISTLGNLCIDIVLNIPHLPPKPLSERKAFMDELSSSPPDKECWEAGGHLNTAIAASRMGLLCVAIGNVCNDIYGNFLLDVIRAERISFVGMCDDSQAPVQHPAYQTLLCWVLVDSLQRHGFCSPADFLEQPAFDCINEVTRDVKMTIRRSKVLMVNGFGFDELSPGVMVSALKHAVEVGTCIFFDPGPKGRSLSTGTPEKRRALSEFLKMSHVILITSEEAEALTGIGNPILAGQKLLERGIQTKWVIIKIGSKGSVLITSCGTSCVPSFKVKVIDTVGCGDSFVAAIAFGFVHDMPIIHTLTFANAVGASTAMGSGAGRNVATFAKTMELIKAGDPYYDDEFWRELLNGSAETPEITLVSKKPMTGVEAGLNIVPFERVISELISMLKSTKQGAIPIR